MNDVEMKGNIELIDNTGRLSIKPVVRLVAGSVAQARPSEPLGTRYMDSTPPSTTRSSQPDRTFIAAMFTAFSPDAQKQLRVTGFTSCKDPSFLRLPRGV